MKHQIKNIFLFLCISFCFSKVSPSTPHQKETAVSNIEKILLLQKKEIDPKEQSKFFRRLTDINQECNELKLRLEKLGSKKKFWWTGKARKASIKKTNKIITRTTKLQHELETAKENQMPHDPNTIKKIIKKHEHALKKAYSFLKRVEKLLQKHGN